MPIAFGGHEDCGYIIGYGVAKAETEKALLFESRKPDQEDVFYTVDSTKDGWYPKSQIHRDSDIQAESDGGTLVITEWLAEQKGFL